ncbi:MAG TPA: chromosome partitioning ATPase, partial [Casimicrobiaceae bacterium]|nr:chromosome partitioning ATPase [Casimicrobiaceae bacterium]
MSLIEQAAKRLEELRRAGVEVPEAQNAPSAAAESAGTIESATAKLQAATQAAPKKQRASIGSVPTSPLAPVARAADDTRRVHLDLGHLAAKGIVTPDAPRSQMADEFRVIKRPLIMNAMGKGAAPIKNGNLIMVTSALPGEGKTYTAVNLAISVAMEY